MHLNIQGRHLSITPALNDYVKAKIQKVKYHFDHIIHAHVVLQLDKEKFVAEATLTVEHHHFHNKITSDDMYKSIDLLFDKIERQVRRYKEALRDKKRRFLRKKNTFKWHSREILELQQASKIFIDDIQVAVKPMSNLEAVLQLALEKKPTIKGFFNVNNEDHLSFLIKEAPADQYALIAYNDIWEFSSLKYIGREASNHSKEEIVIHQVEPITASWESIEQAVDFLLDNESYYRFFTSLRTEREMLLYKVNNTHFKLLREET
ncbi:hypothetical protein COTS27_00302 [Spirochaetota bacterium]|nr:hypothetical protein COTS27_00302 [Spirochaetota bacterium]